MILFVIGGDIMFNFSTINKNDGLKLLLKLTMLDKIFIISFGMIQPSLMLYFAQFYTPQFLAVYNLFNSAVTAISSKLAASKHITTISNHLVAICIGDFALYAIANLIAIWYPLARIWLVGASSALCIVFISAILDYETTKVYSGDQMNTILAKKRLYFQVASLLGSGLAILIPVDIELGLIWLTIANMVCEISTVYIYKLLRALQRNEESS